MCSNDDDFNNRILLLTAKLLKQDYRYHTIRKSFTKFYHRHSELIVKYNIGLKIVSEYDQEIPHSPTADNSISPQGRATQPSRDTRKTNYAKQPALSSPSRTPLLQQGISEPIFYGDLVYRFKRIVGKSNFSDQFKKIIKRYKKLDIT